MLEAVKTGIETLLGTASVEEPATAPATSTKIDPVIKIGSSEPSAQLPAIMEVEEGVHEIKDQLQQQGRSIKEERQSLEKKLKSITDNQKTMSENQQKAEIVAGAGIALALVIFFLRK